MAGLVLSEAFLFIAAGLLGFALGWRVCLLAAARRARAAEQDVEHLRHALSEAQVRRARAS